ncbi:MAG: DUF3179 domain-containing protein [Desulfuromonadales bacterium]|nr:DUF3179 domain-containing protein [Desulfuromonadales bacterium]
MIWSEEGKQKSSRVRTLFILLALVTILPLAFGALLLNDVGQLFNLPTSWVFSFYYYRIPLSIAACILAILLVIYQRIHKLAKKFVMVVLILAVAGSLFLTHTFVPDVFLRSIHHTAQYTSIQVGDEVLQNGDEVLVLEVNGVARAFPRQWMRLPHLAGGDFAGEQVSMSYCVLSDLPIGYTSEYQGQITDYKVIAQVHNNLVFVDRNSGELFQQITGKGIYDNQALKQYPVQRMPWRAFRSLYPDGMVLAYPDFNLLDQISTYLFDMELVDHYAGKPLFPTLDLKDNRLPPGEQVLGIEAGGEYLAVTNSFMETNPLHTIQLGGETIVLAWFPEYETYGVFKGELNGQPVTVSQIDPYGKTPEGKLERLNTSPGVFWMVWSHWFPETKVLM